MVIQFTLSPKADEQQLVTEFCDMIVGSIRQDIYRNIIPIKLELLKEHIINASWMKWIRKPTDINMMQLIKFALSHLNYSRRGTNEFIIKFDNVLIPNSNTSLDSVIRFIDMGNEVSVCTTFITKIFNEYRDNLNDYWQSYVYLKLKKHTTSTIRT